MRFHELVKHFREAGATTQRELATASGLSYETVRSFEYGRRRPVNYLQAMRLMQALGLDAAESDQFMAAYMFGDNIPDAPGLFRGLHDYQGSNREGTESEERR